MFVSPQRREDRRQDLLRSLCFCGEFILRSKGYVDTKIQITKAALPVILFAKIIGWAANYKSAPIVKILNSQKVILVIWVWNLEFIWNVEFALWNFQSTIVIDSGPSPA